MNENFNANQAVRYCGHCGAPVYDGGNICPECAAKQNPAYAQPVQQPMQQPVMQPAPARSVNSLGKGNFDKLLVLILAGSALVVYFLSYCVSFLFDLDMFKHFDFMNAHWLLNDGGCALFFYAAAVFTGLFILIQYRKGSGKTTFMGFAYLAMAVLALFELMYYPIYYIIGAILRYDDLHFEFINYIYPLVFSAMIAAFVIGAIALLKGAQGKFMKLMVLVAPLLYIFTIVIYGGASFGSFFFQLARACLAAALFIFAIEKCGCFKDKEI